MLYSLITFRSITPAQRGEKTLRRLGVYSTLTRTPSWMQEKGCGYSLRVRLQDVQELIKIFDKENISFQKIYLLKSNGFVEEVNV